MTKQRNAQLDALITEFGFSHQALADEVNQTAERMFGEPTLCTDRHVRRWISGDVQWPWSQYLLPLQSIFGRSAEAMGFVPRKSSRVPAPPRKPAETRDTSSWGRREFIGAGLVATLGLDGIPVNGRLGATDVERIRKVVPTLYRHDHALGGGALHGIAVHALQRVHHALDRCSYGDRMGRALYAAAGDLAASAGWFAYDAGHQEAATKLYNRALQAGILAGDGMLQARVWSNLAMQARFLQRHQEAVHIGRAAIESRQAKGNAWLMALLHCRQAVGHARMGDRVRAERSLARAETAYDRRSGQPPAWLSFLTAAELTGLAGAAHQALGRHGRAQDLTVAALDMLEPRFERNRVYYTAQHARALLDGGEIEQGVERAEQAFTLAGRVNSERIVGKLADLRGEARRFAHVPAAADFLERTQERRT
ncbi:hypothetical protein [Streptomyces minutiscleroticus]|uniref:hypothetical protein n=1 Tax=Streptomyces minutiscleroticus TaxID=68238 RepID=UPI00332E5FE6